MLEPTEGSIAEAEAKARRSAQRRTWLGRLALVVLAGAVIWGLYYFLVGRNHVGTDNAYVNAEVAQVTPLISGQAVEVAVKDTETVKRGQLLVRLDPTNPQIAMAQAQAELAEAQRRPRSRPAAPTSPAPAPSSATPRPSSRRPGSTSSGARPWSAAARSPVRS